MTGPSEQTGRAREFALQRLARQHGRDTQELLTLYALEGLLARLAASDHREQLVVKGGMLLAAFAQRRPTRDLDLHAQQLESDVDAVRDLIAEVAALDLDDGLDFDTSGATTQVIREDDQYRGVRVTLTVDLHTAKLSVKVDVNVGDRCMLRERLSCCSLVMLPPVAGRRSQSDQATRIAGHRDRDGHADTRVSGCRMCARVSESDPNGPTAPDTPNPQNSCSEPASGIDRNGAMAAENPRLS